MCVLMRCIKTVQDITKIQGQKKATAVLIAIDTTLFLLVFRDVLIGELSIPLFIAIASGYIVGYYLGDYIENKMALGKVKVTIKIGKSKSHELARVLKEHGFIFTQSKRHYNHNGKLRKLHEGIIYRNELPTLKRITKKFNFVASIEDVKGTFGKRLINTKEYLELSKEAS